jgi:poly-gamma-glutamate capsule biosynthesis protein CapA/YwtB (metallophosphatase superfamily)
VKNPESIVFVGDFCLAGDSRNYSESNILPQPWSIIRNAFDTNLKIVANVEGAFTDSTKGIPYKWANVKFTKGLSNQIFEGLSLAILGNNHVGDFGPRGVVDTCNFFIEKGISIAGQGSTLVDAIKPAIIHIGEKRLGVVSLCCPTTNSEYIATHQSPGVAPLGMATLKQAIEQARPQCDALVAYLHWGCEWVHDPAPDQLRLARQAIDCGADAVIGSHSHTIQSYEQYNGRWIFYGLGNFLFDAGEAQIIHTDGRIEKVPLLLKPENRESLAVSFKIIDDKGSGNLELDRIQPMSYSDEWKLKPVQMSDLTFDLSAANTRLKRYVKRHARWLTMRHEVEFKSILRNGVLAYWYRNESIIQPTKAIKIIKLCSQYVKRFRERVRRIVR